jgi:two-component system, sensor histidine kinase and response regulator
MEMDATPKILIIDDEEIVLDSCTHILGHSGYQIMTANNGNMGLEVLKKENPDLVFVDLKMPGISGLEVLEKIQEYDATIVPIVITGFATVSSAVDAMKKGAYDFLPKPFTPDEMRVIAHRAIDKRKLVLETISLRREKDMLREQFAAIVSHELKSPLSAVQQSMYGLLADLEDALSQEQKDKIGRLQSRIADLIKLVNTWLRAISVDISTIRENFEPISIPKIVETAIENVQQHAIRKDISIESVLNEPFDIVSGNDVTLVEALVNIIGNSVKYTQMGGKIFIEARQTDDEILIAINDTGVGISNEDIPHIFDDFYVGTRKPEGERRSGVGLAITKRIIEAHDGIITVESELGKGSTFMIHLPLQKQQKQLTKEQEVLKT